MSASPAIPHLVILCAPEDLKLAKRLNKALTPLKRHGRITCWYPGCDVGGEDVSKRLQKESERATYFLALLSLDFWDTDADQLAQRHAQDATRTVIPIMVRKVGGIDLTPYGPYKAIDAAKVAGEKNWDEAWSYVVAELRRVLEAATPPEPTTQPGPAPLRLFCSDLHAPPESLEHAFLGRQGLLHELRDILLQDKQVSLTALQATGGMGKTRLAAELVWRYHEHFPGGVFWLMAENENERRTQLHAILKQLKPQTPDLGAMEQQGRDLDKELQAALVQHTADRRSLWVVDNFPEQRGADPGRWRLSCPKMSILYTSRARISGLTFKHMAVPPLDEEAAVALLTLPLQENGFSWEPEDAALIAERVGHLPLALEILARYLAEGVPTLSKLAQTFAVGDASAEVERAMEILRPDLPEGTLQGVAETFAISYHSLSPDAQHLARVLAHFGPEPVPQVLVDALGDTAPETALRQLRRHHFLTGADSPGSMHRLLAGFLRSLCLQRDEMESARDALCVVMTAQTCQDPRYWPDIERCAPHAQVWWERLEQIQEGDAAPILRLMGWYYNLGRYPESKRLAEVTNRLLVEALGQEHPDTLTSMNNLASTLWSQGEHLRARELEEEVLEVRKRVLGQEHPDTLNSMASVASTLWSQGEYVRARELDEELLEVRRRVLGQEHPDTLRSMNNLASVLSTQGEYVRARELQEEVVEVSRRVLGKEHPNTLHSMASVASLLWSQGEYVRARELDEEVLEVRKRVLGQEHPDTLTSMNNLAGTLKAQGEHVRARELEEEVLEVSKRVLGQEHPNTLTSMNNLAWTLVGLRDKSRALELVAVLQSHLASEEVLKQSELHRILARRLPELRRRAERL